MAEPTKDQLSQFSIFRDFSPEELAYIAKNLVQEAEYRPREVIFEQGKKAEAFYLLEDGLVREERVDTGGRVLSLRQAEAGDWVGRWPVFSGDPYQTTARAYGQAKLLVCSKGNLEALLNLFPILRERLQRANVVNRLIAIPLFCGFSESDLFYVADLVKRREYPAGETIFEQGEEADAFYVIDTGQVKESITGTAPRGQTWPKYLTAGNFFGRYALMHGAPRRATARAVTDVQLFWISAYDFGCLRKWKPEFEKALTRFDMLDHLRRTILFSKLDDDEMKHLVGYVGLARYRKNDVIFYQGETDPTFYLLYEGEAITHFRDERGRTHRMDRLKADDTIGEPLLFFQGACDVTLKPTTDDTSWLYLTRNDLDLFLGERPKVRDKLLPAEAIKARQRLKRFPWMEPDEELVFEDRRHWFSFIQRSVLPIILLIMAAIFLLVGLSPESSPWWRAIGFIFLISGAIWAGWYFVDWFNDYYAITNRRVVHREKLLLVREKRDEAPLSKIQNVNIGQLFFGNLLGFGTLLVNTAAAFEAERVIFNYLTNPEQVQAIILAQMEQARIGERPRVRRAVRDKLEESVGAGVHPVVRRPVIPVEAVLEPEPPKPGILSWIGERTVQHWFWFEKRTDDRITWRKHWIRLAKRIWLPSLVFLGLLLTLIYYMVRVTDPSGGLIAFLVILLLLTLGWLWWNWEDWGNDLYIVTNDRLIDIEAWPLGFRSQRTETTFDKIQNVSYEIPNPIATILNYGTVFIFTAGAEGRLDFEWVRDPSGIQAEIFRRLNAHEATQRRRQREEQRAELPEWFAVYDETHGP